VCVCVGDAQVVGIVNDNSLLAAVCVCVCMCVCVRVLLYVRERHTLGVVG